MEIRSTDYKLPGLNGLDLVINSQYKLSNANLYKPTFESEENEYDAVIYATCRCYKVIKEAKGFFAAYAYKNMNDYKAEQSCGYYAYVEKPEYDEPESVIGIFSDKNKAEEMAKQNTYLKKTLIEELPQYLERDYKLIYHVAISDDYLCTVKTAGTYTSIEHDNGIQGLTYEEAHNRLGSGWSFGFSSIEIDGRNKYLNHANGNGYKINITETKGDSNLEKYTLNDMRLELYVSCK